MKTRTGNLLRIAALLIAVISAAAFMTVPQAFAKSSMKLSAKKITLTAGKSRILKLSGTSKKAKWYVSGKKLVTVRAKGSKRHKAVVKAGKKAGTCYVKVKAGGKTVKCRVTVKAVPKKEEFKEKPLSETSEDLTSKITRDPVTGKDTDPFFTEAMTGTALKMLKYLSANETDRNRNVLISPDSILTAMAMAENGASGNTLSEMEKAFGNVSAEDLSRYLYSLNGRLTSSKSVKYHIADSVWFRKNEITVKDEFLKKNADYFKAQIFAAPFSDETLNDINNWVYNNTRGMIPSILNRLTDDNVLILLNAIAFEGRWMDEYSDRQVSNKPFYNEDGSVQKVVNILSGRESTYVNVGGADGFVKPYAGGEIAFMGLKTPDGMTVDQFIQSLDADAFIQGYKDKTDKYDVITKMPEFKYDYDTSLVDTLKDLGIKDAFSDDFADFSGITPPDQPVVISDVIHKTHIELDRCGTKAAAVTAVIVDKASSMPVEKEKKNVSLDHPFVYAIIDTESGIPLFIGTVKTV